MSKPVQPVKPAEAVAIDRELGDIAVRMHWLSAAQLGTALQGHTAETLAADYVPGTVFKAKGLLDQRQLDYAETVRHFKSVRIADKRFGELAVARGWASELQVSAAMEVQKLLFLKEHKEVPIGEMLVRQHAITAEQREILLQVQQRAREDAAAQPAPTPAAHRPESAVQPAAAAAPQAATTEVAASEPLHVAAGYKITISPDHLTAFVTLHEQADVPQLEDVRKALRNCSVVHGIDEQVLQRLCANELPRETPVALAVGQAMTPSRDAAVEYLFDIHPLKAGREGEHDIMDFKDRGELPQVATDTVLARKTTAQEGVAGKDVHGRGLKPRKPKDVRMRAGNGVKLAADGLALIAVAAGTPTLTSAGVVSVFPEYRIDGDLGYSTGHVNFNGRVIVSGAVQSGFHVKCGELIASEVEGAEIETEGDVLIRGGVMGARIRAGGSVHGKYFHTTHIEAQGDVVVQTELVDSEVESGGSFHGERCRVLGSRIAVRNAIVALEIGSDSSVPCVLTLGGNDWVQHQIEQHEAAIAEMEQAAQQRSATIAALQQELAELEPRVGAMAQVQDKAMLQRRELEKAARAGDGRAKQTLTVIEEQIASAEQELSGLFDEQDRITADIARLEEEQTEAGAQIVARRAELQQLAEWAQENLGHAEIKVQKVALQGTVIKTPHQEMRLPEDKKLLWLEEREVSNERGESSWQLAHKS